MTISEENFEETKNSMIFEFERVEEPLTNCKSWDDVMHLEAGEIITMPTANATSGERAEYHISHDLFELAKHQAREWLSDNQADIIIEQWNGAETAQKKILEAMQRISYNEMKDASSAMSGSRDDRSL